MIVCPCLTVSNSFQQVTSVGLTGCAAAGPATGATIAAIAAMSTASRANIVFIFALLRWMVPARRAGRTRVAEYGVLRTKMVRYNTREARHDDPADGQRSHRRRRP